ncbi:MAG: hypothetical protein DWQ04_11860 [Chloroflexi bacterium]|nr:MAG: hypothetical protein DWQ04_11860 [Chloroflexota bacterium]
MQVTITLTAQQLERAQRLAAIRRQAVKDVLATVVDEGLAQAKLSPEAEDPAMAREKAAFLKLFPMLQEKYAGQHVAIFGGELVDHDQDGMALSRRVYARYPDKFVWIAPVHESPLPEFRSRSFRWQHD